MFKTGKGKKSKAKTGTAASTAATTPDAIGAPVKGCPKKKGSIVVMLEREKGQELNHRATVVLKDSTGKVVGTKRDKRKVKFTGLKPGGYTVETTLSASDDTYKLQAGHDDQGASVTAGKETLARAVADPPGDLNVIILASDTRAKQGGVTVAIAGPTPGSQATSAGTGKSFFGRRAGGEYTTTLTLPPDVDKNYFVPPTLAKITMPHGTDHRVTYLLSPRPGPKIEIADPKIVLVKRSYQGKAPHNVAPHRIAMILSSTLPFDGEGELTCSGPECKIFDAATKGKELKLPLKVASGDLGGKTVYIEGANPSKAKDGTTFTFELKNGTVVPRPKVDEKITCVRLALEICKSRPDDGSDPVVLERAKQFDPGRPVFEQKEHDKVYFAERAKLLVKKTDPPNIGTLILEPLTASVKLFKEEKPADGQTELTGDDLKIAASSIHGKGKAFWVEGTTKSAKIGDTGWKVCLEEVGTKEGDRVIMSVIKAELELYQSRSVVEADGKPTKFSDDDKWDKGRFLHAQHKQFHGRALVIVKQCEPKEFDGTLMLKAFKVTRKPAYKAEKNDDPRISVFEEEVPATGQAAKAYPFEIKHDGTYPADGKKFWIEGKKNSAALIDEELRLGMKDFDNTGCDRAAFSVITFKNLKADVPSTPANQNRAGNSPVDRHEFIAGENTADKHFDDRFNKNDPLPLVEGSVPGGDLVKLSVEIEPSGLDIKIKWSAIRNKDDADGVKTLAGNTDQPTVTVDGSDNKKATLQSNSVGTFRVRAYIDCNDNDKFDERNDAGDRVDREPYIILNYALVRCQGVTNSSSANSGAGGAITVAAGFSSGDFAGTGNDAATMDATIYVAGGGADGKLGLEYLFAGWLNNEKNAPGAPNPNGWGEDVTHHHSRPIPATGPPPALVGLRCYWQNAGARISGPMLDSGYNSQGTGGDSCTGTGGSETTYPDTKTDDTSGIGQRWRIKNYDSPGGAIVLRHPSSNSTRVVRFKFNIDFQCALLVWTNASKTRRPSTHAANRLYSYVYRHDWTVRFEMTVARASPYAETIVTARTITITADNSTNNASPVVGTGLETRQPDGLNSGQFDQPFDPARPNDP